MIEEKRPSLHENSVALCRVYEKLVEEGQVSFPMTEEAINRIDSVVKTVNANYFGISRFLTQKDKAAAFFCLIIKDHVVTDGNKRLSTLWLQIYCDACGIQLDPKIPLDILAVSVEDEKELELYKLVSIVKNILFKN